MVSVRAIVAMSREMQPHGGQGWMQRGGRGRGARGRGRYDDQTTTRPFSDAPLQPWNPTPHHPRQQHYRHDSYHYWQPHHVTSSMSNLGIGGFRSQYHWPLHSPPPLSPR